jgi:hypothetical protein
MLNKIFIFMKKISFTFFLILCFTQICCGQKSNTPITKTQALGDVKVASIQSWKEIVSDEGRFRIIFPQEPKIEEETDSKRTIQRYTTHTNGIIWYVYYTDFDHSTTDETILRDGYRKTIAASTQSGMRLLRQNEIILNGKIGVDFILEGNMGKKYERIFLINRRMYSVAVHIYKKVDNEEKLSAEIKQFFDSFTFWE